MSIVVDVRDAPITPPDQTTAGLTADEQWMLVRAASGWRIAAIAAALGLSPDAVEGALTSIVAMVGARSKIEAVLIAVRDDLIDVPAETDQEDGRAHGHRASVARPVMRLRQWRLDGQR